MAQKRQPVKPGPALAQDPARLLWRRRAAGLSVRDLAERADVAVGTVSMLERGKYSAEAATLAKLAKALDCKITDIMPDEPNGSAA